MDPYKTHMRKIKKNKVKSVQRPVQRKRPRKKKSKFPIGVLIYSIIISAGAYAGINHLDSIERFISKVDINMFGQLLAQDQKSEKTMPTESPVKEQTSLQPRSEITPVSNIPVKKDINYFKMLEGKEVVLKEKEESLKKLELNLQQQKEELLVKIKELEQLRSDISLSLKDKVDTDKKTVDKLVQVYANMKPKSAAPVLEKMNDELAVKILHKMKKKNAAAILNVIKAEKAKHLTEKIAGYQP